MGEASRDGGGELPSQNPIKNFGHEALNEGKKELVKRIVQGAFGLAMLVTTFVLALLTAAYFLLLEPRIARHIASIITAESNFKINDSKYANPLDDYILKVFLMEIGNQKGSRSAYAGQITEHLKQGQIKEGFRIFSNSIGQEIDMLDQIKTGYQHPTTVQFGSIYYEVSLNPSPPLKRQSFPVLVSRGQILELLATDLRVDILA
jgi:hypothetical protein